MMSPDSIGKFPHVSPDRVFTKTEQEVSGQNQKIANQKKKILSPYLEKRENALKKRKIKKQDQRLQHRLLRFRHEALEEKGDQLLFVLNDLIDFQFANTKELESSKDVDQIQEIILERIEGSQDKKLAKEMIKTSNLILESVDPKEFKGYTFDQFIKLFLSKHPVNEEDLRVTANLTCGGDLDRAKFKTIRRLIYGKLGQKVDIEPIEYKEIYKIFRKNLSEPASVGIPSKSAEALVTKSAVWMFREKKVEIGSGGFKIVNLHIKIPTHLTESVEKKAFVTPKFYHLKETTTLYRQPESSSEGEIESLTIGGSLFINEDFEPLERGGSVVIHPTFPSKSTESFESDLMDLNETIVIKDSYEKDVSKQNDVKKADKREKQWNEEIENTLHFSGMEGIIGAHSVVARKVGGQLVRSLVLDAAGFDFPKNELHSEDLSLISFADARSSLQQGELTLEEFRVVLDQFEEAVKGIRSMHNIGFVHRDIKPDNFLLTERGGRVCDFGAAIEVGIVSGKKSYEGTLYYSPPECIAWIFPEYVESKETVSPSWDIWSLGMALQELVPTLLGNHLYTDKRGALSHPFYRVIHAPDLLDVIELLSYAYKNEEIEDGSDFHDWYNHIYPEPDDKTSIEHLIWSCTRLRPEERIQTIDEFLARFETAKINLLNKLNVNLLDEAA